MASAEPHMDPVSVLRVFNQSGSESEQGEHHVNLVRAPDTCTLR